MTVVARQGYAKTSLSDIASAVGMSKGAVHYHFKRKQQLIGRVLERACEAASNPLRSACTETVPPAAALYAAMTAMWRSQQEHPQETTVMVNLAAQSMHDPTLRDRLAQHYRMRAKLVPRAITALLDGLFLQIALDPQALDEAELAAIFELVARSLAGEVERPV